MSLHDTELDMMGYKIPRPYGATYGLVPSSRCPDYANPFALAKCEPMALTTPVNYNLPPTREEEDEVISKIAREIPGKKSIYGNPSYDMNALFNGLTNATTPSHGYMGDDELELALRSIIASVIKPVEVEVCLVIPHPNADKLDILVVKDRAGNLTTVADGKGRKVGDHLFFFAEGARLDMEDSRFQYLKAWHRQADRYHFVRPMNFRGFRSPGLVTDIIKVRTRTVTTTLTTVVFDITSPTLGNIAVGQVTGVQKTDTGTKTSYK